MNIDITAPPPVDIFRDRSKHLWASIGLLFLALSGVLLIGYGIFSDTQHGTTLETVALSLLVGSALLFSYFGAKLNSYKRLSVGQKTELAELSTKHAVIAAYFALVAKEGREPIFAEYEACKEWEENFLHQQEQAK